MICDIRGVRYARMTRSAFSGEICNFAVHERRPREQGALCSMRSRNHIYHLGSARGSFETSCCPALRALFQSPATSLHSVTLPPCLLTLFPFSKSLSSLATPRLHNLLSSISFCPLLPCKPFKPLNLHGQNICTIISLRLQPRRIP